MSTTYLSSASRDLDLDTTHVQLGSTYTVAFVQGNDLRPNEIVARGKVGHGKAVDALLTARSTIQLFHGPHTAAEAVRGNLDPDIALAVAGLGRDVDLDGALVRLGHHLSLVLDIVVPFYINLNKSARQRPWQPQRVHTLSPALTATWAGAGVPGLLHVMYGDRTSFIGSLLATERM